MAITHLRGTAVHTFGSLPPVGSQAPDFRLVTGDLRNVSLGDFVGKRKVLNISPSLDTGVCAAAARRFNQEASTLDNTVVFLITADLPFAQQRFCSAEGLTNVVSLSLMRGRDFAKHYGVLLEEGPMAGLCARAVVILDPSNKVIYTQLVDEITDEPDYEAAIAALK